MRLYLSAELIRVQEYSGRVLHVRPLLYIYSVAAREHYGNVFGVRIAPILVGGPVGPSWRDYMNMSRVSMIIAFEGLDAKNYAYTILHFIFSNNELSWLFKYLVRGLIKCNSFVPRA